MTLATPYEQLAAALANAGLDLLCPFGVAQYNDGAAACDRLPDFGLANAFGILVGNTRRLWRPFTQAFSSEAWLAAHDDPLDAYVERQIEGTLRRLVACASEIVWAHTQTPRAFPIQRLAERIGFGEISPSHLLIHPRYGPWLALRAVIVLDTAGPARAANAACPPICKGCDAPCVGALERALDASGTPLTRQSVSAHLCDWIAVRDACPVGRAERYSNAQTEYHYAPEPWRIERDRR